MWTQQAPEKKGTPTPTQFLAHGYCGQMAGWMKTPLGTEVDLGSDHIVLDGVPAPAKGVHPPLFGPYLLWPRSPISATTELLLNFRITYFGKGQARHFSFNMHIARDKNYSNRIDRRPNIMTQYYKYVQWNAMSAHRRVHYNHHCHLTPNSMFEQVRAIATCRDSSNLVADRFAASLSQIPLCYLVTDRFEAGRRPASSLLAN